MKSVLTALCAATLISASPASFSKDVLENQWVSTGFWSAEMQSGIGFEIVVYFLRSIGCGEDFVRGRSFSPGTFSEDDVKLVIAEIDRISRAMSLLFDEKVHKRPEEAIGIVNKENWANYFIANQRGIDWAKRNREFLIRAQAIGFLTYILRALAPDKATSPLTVGGIEYEKLFGSLGATRRFDIQAFLNSNQASAFLPSGYDISTLRQEELEIRQTGLKLGLTVPDGEIFRTSLLLGSWAYAEAEPFEPFINRNLPLKSQVDKLVANTLSRAKGNSRRCM